MRDVIVSASSVRPWKAPSNAITASLPVCRRSELDGVLDRLRPGVEERAPDVAGDRRDRAQALRELDVTLVRHHGVVRVEEAVDLLVDRLDDPRVVVADVRHPDAADEIDERVPVDVGDRRAARLCGDDRLVHDQRARDGAVLALEDLPRAWAGNLGPAVR